MREATVDGMTYKILHDFVLVHDGPIRLKTQSGLYYPMQYVEGIESNMWRRGKVLALGPGRRSRKTGELIPHDEIAVGDYVLYPRTVGSKIKQMEGVDQWLRILDPKQIFMREG